MDDFCLVDWLRVAFVTAFCGGTVFALSQTAAGIVLMVVAGAAFGFVWSACE